VKHFKLILTDAMEIYPYDNVLHLLAGVKRQYFLKGVVDIEFVYSGKPDGANILFDRKEMEL